MVASESIPIYLGIVGLIIALGLCSTPETLALGEEQKPADEDETIQKIVGSLVGRNTTFYHGRQVLRDTHPKSNGLVRARFRVNESFDIPEHYRKIFGDLTEDNLSVGLFEHRGKEFDAWIRMSNSEDHLTHDRNPEFRGVAIKIFRVQGPKALDEGPATFDILTLAHDAFFAATPKDFHRFFELRFFWISKPFGDLIARLSYIWLQPRGAFNGIVGQRQITNSLRVNWYSIAPSLLGVWPEQERFKEHVRGRNRAIKYRLEPFPPARKEEIAPPKEPSSPNYLRENAGATLAQEGYGFHLHVQIQTNPRRQPIEDTTIAWNKEDSPWIHVADVHFPKQDDKLNSDQRLEFDENMTFNPWHCHVYQRPLGGVNRARRGVMQAYQTFRLQTNEKTPSNPTGPGTPE